MPAGLDAIVEAPTVSDNPNSTEAKMARDAKKIQVQTETDSKFDTVLERFADQYAPYSQEELNIPLVGALVAVVLLGAAALFTGKRRF